MTHTSKLKCLVIFKMTNLNLLILEPDVEVLPFCFLPGHWLFIPSGEEKWTLTYSGSQFCIVVIVLIFNSVFTAHLSMDARFNLDIVYRKSHNLVYKITHFLHVSGTSFICLNSDNKTVQGLLFITKKVNGCNYFIFVSQKHAKHMID